MLHIPTIFTNFVIESNKPIRGFKMEDETVLGNKKRTMVLL